MTVLVMAEREKLCYFTYQPKEISCQNDDLVTNTLYSPSIRAVCASTMVAARVCCFVWFLEESDDDGP
jgi:hypothetical protein